MVTWWKHLLRIARELELAGTPGPKEVRDMLRGEEGLLAVGSNRVVFRRDHEVYKIQFDSEVGTNGDEVALWEKAKGTELGKKLVPVTAMRWGIIVMPFAGQTSEEANTYSTDMVFDVQVAAKKAGVVIGDLHAANLTSDGRVLDYTWWVPAKDT